MPCLSDLSSCLTQYNSTHHPLSCSLQCHITNCISASTTLPFFFSFFLVETSSQVLINNTWASHKEKVIRQELDEPEKGLIFKVLSQSSNFSPRKSEGQRFHKGKRYQRFSCWGGQQDFRVGGSFCKITALRPGPKKECETSEISKDNPQKQPLEAWFTPLLYLRGRGRGMQQ